MPALDDDHFYREFAAAFCRGRLDLPAEDSATNALEAGAAAALRLHKFKRNATLPRVRKVLGILRGLGPSDLLDIGSGRGTFLWPLLDALPWIPVTAIDRDAQRTADLDAVRRGGVTRLRALRMDATGLEFGDDIFDVTTALEVLEHLQQPEAAVRELVRVARRCVVVSVPSREDDNPEHIQLFDEPRLRAMLLAAGARNVNIEFVPDHMVAVATLATPRS